VVDGLELRPRVAAGACDLAVRLAGRRVFLEVTTRDDRWPFGRGDVEDPPMQARETVHREFRTTTPDRVVPTTRDVPASEDLRAAIRREVRQLPAGELTAVVLGTPNSQCLAVEDALFGDGQLVGRGQRSSFGRVANGLFAVSDEEGGLAVMSAVVWLKLRHHWQDIRTGGRLFPNPRARAPLPPGVEAVFRRVFEPSAVLTEEVRRIRRILVEQYRAERVILFGSLATDCPADAVHDASDIDLAVVKPTGARFVDRVREALDLVEPRAGVNLLVYTPAEIAEARASGPSFIRDEILGKGKQLFPADG
jgi:predicted nucleotidyltransferase